MNDIALIDRSPAPRDPATAYLASLAPGSRRTMIGALEKLALLCGMEPLCPRCKRVTRGWPLERGDRCSPPDWAACLRDPSKGVLYVQRFPWHELTFAETAAIRAKLIDQGGAPEYVRKILAALRGVLKAAYRMELMTAEHYQRAISWERVRGERCVPPGRALDPSEVAKLFPSNLARELTLLEERDSAMLVLLFAAGLRRSEAVTFHVEQFDGRSLLVRGKGNRERLVPLPEWAAARLRQWLSRAGLASGPVLRRFSPQGVLLEAPMSTQAIYARLETLAIRAGVSEFSPHDARRTYISTLLDAGADLAAVQRLAGHSSPAVTSRYDRRDERAAERAASLLTDPTQC